MAAQKSVIAAYAGAWKKFFSARQSEKNGLSNTVVLIPLAGKGQRFVKKGYAVPKPLIEVDEKPMFMHVVDAFPGAKEYVFVCYRGHITSHHIDQAIKKWVPNAKIVVDEDPQGQAASCQIAEHAIDPKSPLLIASCDYKVVWNPQKFGALTKDQNTKAILWTFKNNPLIKRDPKTLGFVKTSGDNAEWVFCKQPISDSPQNDHAITAIFYFQTAKIFFDATRQMIQKNRRVNNEFYVDTVPNELLDAGQKVKVFLVDHFADLGTPENLQNYEYWKKKAGNKK